MKTIEEPLFNMMIMEDRTYSPFIKLSENFGCIIKIMFEYSMKYI